MQQYLDFGDFESTGYSFHGHCHEPIKEEYWLENVTQVSVGRVGVFKGAVSLALQDGLLTNGEKRMLVKLSHTLKLDEDEPKAVYDAVISGKEIGRGEELALERTRRIYEQMLGLFSCTPIALKGEVLLVAYLRHIQYR